MEDNIKKMADGLDNTPLPGMPTEQAQQAYGALPGLSDDTKKMLNEMIGRGPDDERAAFQAEKERILQLQQTNEQRLQRLAAQGIRVDQTVILQLRLFALLDFHLGDMDGGKPEMCRWPRLGYERRVQVLVSQKLDEAERMVREAQLTQGVVPPTNGHRGGLIVPGSN